MPFPSLSFRRAVGLGAAVIATTLAVALWISVNKSGKRKKKTISESREKDIPTEVSKLHNSVELKPDKTMEVIVERQLTEPVETKIISDDENSLSPTSKSWVELLDEEEQELTERENSTDNKLTLIPSQPTRDVQSQIESASSRSMDARKSRSSSDSGVVSPIEKISEKCITEPPAEPKKTEPAKKDLPKAGSHATSNKNDAEKNGGKVTPNLPSCNSSDSGQGSETGDSIRYTYHFNVPSELTGKLIGHQGQNIDRIRNSTQCEISVLRPHEYAAAMKALFCDDKQRFSRQYIRKFLLHGQEIPPKVYNETQVCVVEGTRSVIDRCLEYLREMFPLETYPQFTLQQINVPKPMGCSDTGSGSPQYHQQLMLSENILYEVSVCAIVSPSHIFVQQPTHPSFPALSRLDGCMNNVYSRLQAPDISRSEIKTGLVCAAKSEGKWYRVQILSYDAVTDCCDVKFVDYGGYHVLPATDLRKIRSDFLKLPFQAIECYLSNVIPTNSTEWSLESGYALQELLTRENQALTCRMLGLAGDFVPMVHLYATSIDGNSTLINRELVDIGGAAWIEN